MKGTFSIFFSEETTCCISLQLARTKTDIKKSIFFILGVFSVSKTKKLLKLRVIKLYLRYI